MCPSTRLVSSSMGVSPLVPSPGHRKEVPPSILLSPRIASCPFLSPHVHSGVAPLLPIKAELCHSPDYDICSPPWELPALGRRAEMSHRSLGAYSPAPRNKASPYSPVFTVEEAKSEPGALEAEARLLGPLGPPTKLLGSVPPPLPHPGIPPGCALLQAVLSGS